MSEQDGIAQYEKDDKSKQDKALDWFLCSFSYLVS